MIGDGRMKKYQDALENLAEKTYGYEEKSYAVLQELINHTQKQMNSRWIPVSERLPKESRYYLCTVEHYGASTKELLDRHDIEIQVSTESMFFNKDNKRWGKWNDVNNFKVTAWQPLPPAWKGENDG